MPGPRLTLPAAWGRGLSFSQPVQHDLAPIRTAFEYIIEESEPDEDAPGRTVCAQALAAYVHTLEGDIHPGLRRSLRA